MSKGREWFREFVEQDHEYGEVVEVEEESEEDENENCKTSC